MKQFLIILLIMLCIKAEGKKKTINNNNNNNNIVKISFQPARINYDPLNLHIQLEVKIMKNLTLGASYYYKGVGAKVFGTIWHWPTVHLYYHLFGNAFKDSMYLSPEFNIIATRNNIVDISESKLEYIPGILIGYQFHWNTFFTRIGFSYPRALIWDLGVSF